MKQTTRWMVLLLMALLLDSGWSLEAAIGHKDLPDEQEIFTKDRMVDDNVEDGTVRSQPQDQKPTKYQQQQQQQQQQQPAPEQDMQVQARTTTLEVEEFDDRTYLDLFGEKAKEFLTQKLIPTTDLECQWNWKHGRCEPLCLCSFQPKRGDFHLGRACRRVPADQTENCDELQGGPSFPAFPTPMMQATVRNIQKRSATIQRKVSTRFDKLYGRIQELACQEVQQRCGMDGYHEQHFPAGEDSQIFAWQEKLFCKEYINECGTDR